MEVQIDSIQKYIKAIKVVSSKWDSSTCAGYLLISQDFWDFTQKFRQTRTDSPLPSKVGSAYFTNTHWESFG